MAANGFMLGSVGSFRKGGQGAGHWLRTFARPEHLPAIFATGGLSTDDLNAWLLDLEQLDFAAAREAAPVEPAVYEP